MAKLYKEGAANILAEEGYLDGYSAFQARNAVLIYAQRVRVINPVREAFAVLLAAFFSLYSSLKNSQGRKMFFKFFKELNLFFIH